MHTNAHIFFIVSNSDYMAVSMTLDTFTNQRPRQCFNVSITNDATSEETENFTARLMLVPGSVATISADRIVVDPPEARVQITDNDHGKYSGKIVVDLCCLCDVQCVCVYIYILGGEGREELYSYTEKKNKDKMQSIT